MISLLVLDAARAGESNERRLVRLAPELLENEAISPGRGAEQVHSIDFGQAQLLGEQSAIDQISISSRPPVLLRGFFTRSEPSPPSPRREHRLPENDRFPLFHLKIFFFTVKEFPPANEQWITSNHREGFSAQEISPKFRHLPGQICCFRVKSGILRRMIEHNSWTNRRSSSLFLSGHVPRWGE